MSKHKPFKDIQDPGEQELYLSKLIKQYHDDELRDKWESIVDKEPLPHTTRNKKNTFGKIVLAILLIAMTAFILLNLMPTKEIDPSQFAMKELNQKINHPGLTKGSVTDTDNRSQAIIHFNAKDFEKAIVNFSNIENQNTEDSFYLAMSHLYTKEYNRAAQLLGPIADSESILNQEAKWYVSIAHTLNKSTAKARTTLREIQPNDWNYKKAQELLKGLTN